MDISELTLKTEADHTNRVPMDARLKTLLLRYALSAILATVLVSGAIITESYITSLGDTLNKFQTLKINSVKMKDASRKEGEIIASVRSIFRSYAKGEATVTLPDWFEALNRDFRYQLTALGQAAPDLHVKSKLHNGAFSIGGGTPGQEISWQLTGIRQDAWANANRIPVEEEKAADERGLYLHPTVHGQPAARGIDAVRNAALKPHLGG